MKISVVMPAFNAENYIKDSIESILSQTFNDFELIIVNDNSSDNTPNIIKEFEEKDSRIIVIHNSTTLRVAESLNIGLKAAKGEYIIRTDADDICLPKRFETQVRFMDENNDIGIAGSWYEMFGDKEGVKELPLEHNLIKIAMLFHGAIAHPTVIFRRKLFEDNNLRYNPQIAFGQDYDLWVRASNLTKFANIPEVLLRYRIHKKNVGTEHSLIQGMNARKVRKSQLLRLGIYPTYEEMEIHQSLADWNYSRTNKGGRQTLSWLERIIVNNHKYQIYNEKLLVKYLYEKWLSIYKEIENPSKITQNLIHEIENVLNNQFEKEYIKHINTLVSKIEVRNDEFYSTESPRVSIVMAAYNSERYIREAIESMLNQTYKNFEYIIINDASKDNTEQIVKEYQLKDERVILVDNVNEKGIAGAANTGLEKAKGDYIARMDSDDISLPTRVEEQLEFMDSHQEIGACGGWVELMGIDDHIVWDNPVDPDQIICFMLFYGAIANPVVMLRSSVLKEHNLKYVNTAAEDYEMFVRISRFTKLTNIPKVLLKYRLHATNFGKVNKQTQNESANYIRKKQILELGLDPTPREEQMHYRIGLWDLSDNKDFLIDADKWMSKLVEANTIKKIFPEPNLSNLMAEKWLDIYKASDYLGTALIVKFLMNSMYKNTTIRYKLFVVLRIIKVYLHRLKDKMQRKLWRK